MNQTLNLSILTEELAVCRLEADAKIPAWATSGQFFAVNRTYDELSIVCEAGAVPAETTQETPWRAIKVEGPLDFSLTGILSKLSGTLADEGISLFAISTFDTDYILVKADQLKAAKTALAKICHFV